MNHGPINKSIEKLVVDLDPATIFQLLFKTVHAFWLSSVLIESP